MADKWIQKAIKHPGSLTERAKKAGAFKNGKISQEWLDAHKNDKGLMGKRVRLAMTLRNMKKG